MTHGAALGVVRSVGQDEGFGHQGALTLDRAEGSVPTAGQDHVEMGWNGGLVSERINRCQMSQKIDLNNVSF